MKRVGCAVIVCLIACKSTDLRVVPGDFAEIRIESHPQGWGYAHKTVRSDSSIVGGHLSGGDKTPFVFESRSNVSSEDMEALRKAVSEIADKPSDNVIIPNSKHESYASVVITFRDGTTTAAITKAGGRFEAPAFQSIWDIVRRYEVGAW